MSQPVQWRVSRGTYERYVALMQMLEEINSPYSNDHMAVVEEIKGLPGFPSGTTEDTDIDVIVINAPYAAVH